MTNHYREPFALRYRDIRARSLALAEPLSAEDQSMQSMPDASPSKWHQAHQTWFFETMLLTPLASGYQPFDPRFRTLFNSYYDAIEARHPRPQRGLLSRPGLETILAYRRHVDNAMLEFIANAEPERWDSGLPLLELGLQHEQQHQELLLTDILHAFSCNPLLPAYQQQRREKFPQRELQWLGHPAGLIEVGHQGAGFAFDNEAPRHRVWLPAFEIAQRLVTCSDFALFIADGGYKRPALWSSEGWAMAQARGWQHPAYWLASGDQPSASDQWQVFSLEGVQLMDPDAPVMQLSFHEAAAYAEWAGARLPTEFEWEAASALPGITQLYDQAWQWTRSAYHPYPGFKPLAGAVGEYNGKFMINQMVLRGGSLATPDGHSRPSYRNFFPAHARWQFSGLRLARDGAQA